MFAIVLLTLVLLSESRADFPHSWNCASGSGKNVSIQSTDIPGSYIVTYCAPAADEETKWDLRVGILSNISPSNCIFSSKTESRITTRHSSVLIPVQNGNCSRICITTQLYLLYRGCYRLENKWEVGEPYNAYYYVDNADIAGPEYFCNGSLFFHNLGTDPPTFHLYQGHMPVDGYSISVVSNSTDNEPEINISNECSPLEGQAGLRCSLRLPHGCYRLHLQQSAPWFANSYYADHCRLMHHSFCWEEGPPAPAVQAGVPRWAWGALGALLAALGAALLLLLARRSPLSRKLREEAARALQKRLDTLRAAAEAAAAERVARGALGGRVLVLRARDAPAAERAQAQLLRLLRLAAPAPGQVLDLYSAECVAQSAGAPADWLRQALAQPDVRVVLLQTPAVACLHRRRLALQEDPLHLREPLLPQHVVYRSPHPADALLQFALRLLADGPGAGVAGGAPAYRRYFLATLADVPVDVFPGVVPYSRYELPAATLALLRELDPALPESPALLAAVQALADAARDLAAHVRSNQNYLADELMFL